MATGTGFAPIKAMIEHAIRTGEIDRRTFRLYWGGRTEADLYMADLVRRWIDEHPNLSFVPVLSQSADNDRPNAGVKYVQDRLLEDHPDLSGFDIYACGLPAMIRTTRKMFEAAGERGPAHFHTDEFLTAAERASCV
jgi:CDP-4-dehydro-6-deoxyglucose reductase